MSTMVDEKDNLPPYQNVRGLVQDLTELLDVRMARFRRGTPFEHVRPADAKTFMHIARHPNTISQLARNLGITRQAAHNSVLRLVEYQVIVVEPCPGSKRDKIPVLTEAGQDVRRMVASHLKIVEREMAEKIGSRRLEALRHTLGDLLAEDSPLREKP